MFIIDPDPYSLPSYRIGPFRTADLAKNHLLPKNNKVDLYFKERFGNRPFLYTDNGRKAISLVLNHLNLDKKDVVTILTTSGNFYISGCVTAEIEKICRWSREIVPETKAIFLNHEFGVPYENPEELKSYGLPVIEDCANTFLSRNAQGEDPGVIGDYVIYSFPKMFPIQVGGLLVSKHVPAIQEQYHMNADVLQYVKNVLSAHIDSLDDMIAQRLSNYNYLKQRFGELGISERFPMNAGIVPSVFMFKSPHEQLDLPELKSYYYAHGVQCSVFYGEEAFFIPVHQALQNEDLDYFVAIIKSFFKKNSYEVV